MASTRVRLTGEEKLAVKFAIKLLNKNYTNYPLRDVLQNLINRSEQKTK